MLLQLRDESDLQAPSSAEEVSAIVEASSPPITTAEKGTYVVVHVDESVLLRNESTIWLLACVSFCLLPFLYCNRGTRFRSRKLNSLLLTTGALMMLIPSLILVTLWLPSIPFALLSFTDWYLKELDGSPLLTKSVTAGLIQFVGDYAAQCYEDNIYHDDSERKTLIWWPTKHYNCRRGLSLFVDGLILSGPLMHYGYQWMEEAIPTHNGDWKAIVCHVLIDDYVIDNLYIALSFVFTGVSEGHGKDLSSIFRKDFWATTRASLCTNLLLIPIEYFCFGYLSIRFRTLFMNFVDLLWGAIISFMSHRSRRKKTAASSREAS